jgi:hypothetical protein
MTDQESECFFCERKKSSRTKVKCANCQTEWSMANSDFKSRMKQSKSGNLYCSGQCASEARERKPREVTP